MKLLIIRDKVISDYSFSKEDAQAIIACCQRAGKRWSNYLVGFFINFENDTHYVAINIEGANGVIRSIEFIDINHHTPEFTISSDIISQFLEKSPGTVISLNEFKPILTEILTAPVKARQWEIYPDLNQYFQDSVKKCDDNKIRTPSQNTVMGQSAKDQYEAFLDPLNVLSDPTKAILRRSINTPLSQASRSNYRPEWLHLLGSASKIKHVVSTDPEAKNYSANNMKL